MKRKYFKSTNYTFFPTYTYLHPILQQWLTSHLIDFFCLKKHPPKIMLKTRPIVKNINLDYIYLKHFFFINCCFSVYQLHSYFSKQRFSIILVLTCWSEMKNWRLYSKVLGCLSVEKILLTTGPFCLPLRSLWWKLRNQNDFLFIIVAPLKAILIGKKSFSLVLYTFALSVYPWAQIV